jgi:proteasome assembly chaperone (PAC2) family protein
LGLASKKNIPAIAMLSETYGHPMYLGVKGAREILKILNKKIDIDVKLEDLDKEIKDLEKEMMKRTEDLSQVSKQTARKKLKGRLGEETSYIG